MSFKTPITIAKALANVSANLYVLPAIQRDFVWGKEQICKLFDSLMQGYPVGSFLFWQIERAHVHDYTFYGFITDYHERDSRAPRFTPPEHQGLTAILDGQQRLTGLNIGLRGSYAEKQPHKRWTSDAAFPKTHLYLDIKAEPKASEDAGMTHAFAFITEATVKEQNAAGERHWYRASQILQISQSSQQNFASILYGYVRQNGLANDPHAFDQLNRLYQVVQTEQLINYFEEEKQDLDKVLNIFIRVNSGGTVLSHADLLMSIATAQWKERDAREAVQSLVQELNGVRFGFQFPKDLVLKASLVLADIPDIRFQVRNFKASNMSVIEAHWETLAKSLRLAVRLLGEFGFSGPNLSANNVVIPIAYYLMARKAEASYLDGPAHEEDREQVRLWVLRSLIKRGIWGSGLDSLLNALRQVLQREVVQAGHQRFPTVAIETEMRRLGKSLDFSEEELDALLDARYGHTATFALIALLYPEADLRKDFHVDHVFPRSMVSHRELRKTAIDPARFDELVADVDTIANLQMLTGPDNIHKSAKLPDAWVKESIKDEVERNYYLAKHDIGAPPARLEDYPDFIEARRGRMGQRLRSRLGLPAARTDQADTRST